MTPAKRYAEIAERTKPVMFRGVLIRCDVPVEDVNYLLDRIRRAEELLRDAWDHYKRLDYQPEADEVDAFLAGDGQHTTPAGAGEGE